MEEIIYDYEGITISIPENNIFKDYKEMMLNMSYRIPDVMLGEEWCRSYEYESEADPILIRKLYEVENPNKTYYCATFK